MDINKVNYMTTEVEEEEGGEEEEPNEEEEGFSDLPSTTEEAQTELLIDATVTDKPSIVPVTYPKSTRELRSLSYGTIGPAQKKLSSDLKGLQISNVHIAYINRQTRQTS
jgi:hypothetical protein